MTDPRPCLLNSLPKAGTHLLKKVVRQIPGITSSGVAFVVNDPSNGTIAANPAHDVLIGVAFPTWHSRDEVRKQLQQIGCGNFAAGHVPFTIAMADLLEERGMRSILILRDPRDVVISLAHFVPSTPANPLYQHYLPLSWEQRITKSIVGLRDEASGLYFRNIRDRLEGLLPWTNCSLNYTTTFERLVGARGGGTNDAQLLEIRNICAHLGAATAELQIEAIAKRAFGGIGTFRDGTIGAWRQHFTGEHKQLCRDLVGQALIDLGYERDMNW